ncbi:hypothetical protein HQ576_16580, partial [bacterium]|nr:hypothetical protein [bacterium]
RFVLANALDRTLENDWYNCQCSYVDMFPDGDTLNILVPHRWRQVLHLRVQAADLARLPTRADLVEAARTP